ncbi:MULTISPECIES: hypothetical protein [Photorhabdus]|nr:MULTISPECIES: hypothetical protein [Photorhabdus]MCC8387195.1 hypothetical protein [Photorhabdus laumondii]NDL17165.1 hypothetical protein [Photorhabdus laumondii subsp. laumondii]NDL48909.1 hypothetical protein [Photorhabdus laumondii subsp. laumondii]NDL53369.1 hypothetical protein [Photorhabdus laumondii subsp. laumondii]
MTLSEPELLENLHLSPDYDHDINQQIQPIADAILPLYRMTLQFRSPDR